MTLEGEIEEYVKQALDGWTPPKIYGSKVINDPIHGAMSFRNHELILMDCPLLQRLRYIRQLGPANLLYPTANHTRFDHSLGVCHVADRMWRALREKAEEVSGINCEADVPSITRLQVRLAGLLHDIGHGPFSHVSDRFMGTFKDIDKLTSAGGEFPDSNPHEVLSYLILTSKAFQKFFDDNIALPADDGTSGKKRKRGLSLDIKYIAGLILKKKEKDPKSLWVNDIINGPFDADKLDYMLRDSYFTGIRIEVDIERVLFSLDIDLVDIDGERENRIVAKASGVHTLEQILFNKMFLFSSLYHHHKTRAVEAMVNSMYEVLMEDKNEIRGRPLKGPIDLLYLTDHDLLIKGEGESRFETLKASLRKRNLLYRALEMSQSTIDTRPMFQQLMKRQEHPEELEKMRHLINKELGRGRDEVYKVWLDLPKNPSLKESSKTYIRSGSGAHKTMEDYFPVHEWLKNYALNKWKGHIFCYHEDREATKDVARSLFEDLWGLKLKPEADHPRL